MARPNILHLLKSNQTLKNVYLHLPFCMRKCYFCAFPIHAIGNNFVQKKLYSDYRQQLLNQVSILAPQLKYGGGTPSLFPAQQIKQILNYFSQDKTTEITIEFNLSEAHKIKQFKEIGINRISVGVQSLNKQLLQQMNRYNKYTNSLDLVSQSGIQNINLDFILQMAPSEQDFNQVLATISRMKPAHINQGSYLYKNINKFEHITNKNDIMIERYLKVSTFLRQIGYQHYQVSNFALNGNRSKHNQSYWKGDQQFYGFGMGATSFINGLRITRPKKLGKYYQYIQMIKNNQHIDQQFIKNQIQIANQQQLSRKMEMIILSRIRTCEGINWQQIFDIIKRDKRQLCSKEQFTAYIQEQLLQEIVKFNKSVIDESYLLHGVRLQVPQGFLLADFVGLKLIDILSNFIK